MIRHASVCALFALVGCAAQPGELNLRSSFADQIASVAGVSSFEQDGDELRFSGPDGRGGTAAWRVRIDSTELLPGPDEQAPYEGHVVSSWYRDGEPIEPLGSMSGLPDAVQRAGIAQICYALWDPATNIWTWV